MTDMAYWLLKTEPTTYSAADLQRDKTTTWDGVKNPTAVKNIRAMAKGDEVLIYHTGDEKACVAIAEVTKLPRDDPNDPKSAVVDLKFKSMLDKPVTLAEIKADKTFEGYDLIRIGRLSVVPTADKFWKRLMLLSSPKGAK
jgi:predicted RNA-binding protein with PUA-like domain